MKKILNIVGPQGCGKSSLAETIMQFIGGRAVRIYPHDLLHRFTPWLREEPDVVIIDDAGVLTSDALRTLKSFAYSEALRVQLIREEPRLVPTPRFIVCSEQPIADADDRRMLVIGGVE